MGVVFFPSLPFLGVMLFPSFVLGNMFGVGDAFHVSPSPFSVFLFLPLFLLFLFSTSFLSFSIFFEGTACTVCFKGVIDDITDCN